MIIMDSDIFSEAPEFWKEFETEANPYHIKSRSLNTSYKISERFREKSKEIINLERTIKEIRKSNNEKEIQISTNERNQTRGLVQELLKEIEKQFEQELGNARTEYQKMKVIVDDKQGEYSIIQRYLSDREAKITQIRYHYPRKNHVQKARKDEDQDLFKELKKELNLYKIKISALKDAIKTYRESIDGTNAKITEFENLLAKTKIQNEAEIILYEKQCRENIIRAKDEFSKLKNEYEEYKDKNLKSLNSSENVCQNNQDIINSLQSELKSVKVVLTNPVLKLRVHDKLQEYIEEFQGSIKIPSTAPAHRHREYFRPRFASSKPGTANELISKDSNQMLSPHATKIRIFRRKSYCEEQKTAVSKSNQILSNFRNSSFNITFSS